MFWTPIDSSFNALPNFFWNQPDPVERSVTNWQNVTPPKMALIDAVGFKKYFATERFIQSHLTQLQVCRAIQELPNGIRLIKFLLKTRRL